MAYRPLSSDTPTVAALFFADSLSPDLRDDSVCAVYSCDEPSPFVATTSTAERDVHRAPVCESHGQAFLQVVAGLQVADLVPPTFSGTVTARH